MVSSLLVHLDRDTVQAMMSCSTPKEIIIPLSCFVYCQSTRQARGGLPAAAVPLFADELGRVLSLLETEMAID